MKLTCFFLLVININIFCQIDTNYIELISRDRTIQYHATTQDFAVRITGFDEEGAEFRVNNLSTGLYFKFGLAELFFSVPLATFNSNAFDAPNTFGTGFGLNYYKGKFHFNYNFKYAQGYQSLSQVRMDGFRTLTKYDHFFFNRLNIHYLLSPDRFSLSAALRFNNRQRKSAGSWILGAPLSYHFARFGSQEDNYFERYSLAAMGGYGYSHVNGEWTSTVIGKVGADVRYSTYGAFDELAVRPAVNLMLSTVYNVGDYFIGVTYNFYPEYDYSKEFNVEITNWKLRLYAGRRFLD